MPDSDHASADRRSRRAEADDRDGDKVVLTRPGGAANYGYAYHEINDDGTPVCGAPGVSDNTAFNRVTIREAKSREKAPCQTCKRLTE